ncbi:MAG: hypothetical protein ACLVJB_03555 [Christensenellales bacterium]
MRKQFDRVHQSAPDRRALVSMAGFGYDESTTSAADGGAALRASERNRLLPARDTPAPDGCI